MKQYFDFYGSYETPEFILCNPDDTELAFLDAHNRVFTWRYNDTSELTFDYYYTQDNEKTYDLIEVKRLVLLTELGYFQIQKVNEKDDGISKVKSVTAYSIQNELGFKKILFLEGTYKFYDPFDLENTFMGQLLKTSPGWTIGTIDSSLWNRYRTFDMLDSTVLEVIYNNGSKAYGCIFSFDFLNRKISATAVTTLAQNPNRTNIYLSFDNLVKAIDIEESADGIYTALSPYGKDLDIRYVNPIGTNYIYNFSYYMTTEWMPQSLIDAIVSWNKKISDSRSNYTSLLDSLMNRNSELVTLQSELLDLQNKYKEYDVVRSSRISQGLGYNDINVQLSTVQNSINLKQNEITAKNAQITSLSSQMSEITSSLKMEANFTSEELTILGDLTFETTYTNNNYIVTDSMTPDVIQKYAQELYDEAEDELSRLSQPNYTFTVDSANFPFLKEYGLFTAQLEPSCMMYVEKDENNIFCPVLLEMQCPWDDPDTFTLTFGNRFRLDDSSSTFSDLISESSRASSIVGLSSSSWNNFNRNYKNSVSSLINDNFDAALRDVINAANQEIVLNASGLLGRKLKDLAEGETLSAGENPYEDEQVKLINNKLVFTDDGWNSVKSVIGKVQLPDGTYAYGVNVEAVLGKLIAGDQLIIANENNSFYVDGSGARLYNANFTIDNDTTRIVISPETGISIKKKIKSDTYEDIFYVNENGEAYFAGSITAASGYLGGWKIEPDGLSHSNGQYYLKSDGTGRIGLMTFTNTSATFDGNIYAKNLQAGNITLPDGSTADVGYIGNDHIADHSISINKLSILEADIMDLTVDELNTNYGGGKTDYIYIHDEQIEFKSGDLVKAQFAFADINGVKIPALIMGAGDGSGGSRGLIYKDSDSMLVGYTTSSGEENFLDFGEHGIVVQSNGGTYLLDLSDGKEGQVLKKHGSSIIWDDGGGGGGGDWGDANLVILDHTPTEAETAGANENTLFVVYDINDTIARWGSSAYETAAEQGYTGSKDDYNDALSEVGNMSAVLDAILGVTD